MAERMRASLGQTIIVENVSGAGGSIGVGRVARAAPDGYTRRHRPMGTHVRQRRDLSRCPYDLLKDFEPVSLLATNPQLIVAQEGLPAKDLKELIAWLKANPDKASQGTAGAGSASHVGGVYFQNSTGTQLPVRALSRRRRRRCRTWSPGRST